MKNSRIWAIIILFAVLFFVALLITISTKSPLSFLIYIAILTAIFAVFLFTKFREYMGIIIHGRLTVGKITERNSSGKGQNFAIVNYTTKDGSTYTESVMTIALFFCLLIYDKKNPYNIMTLSDFIWKTLFLLTSVGIFGYEIWLIINILMR